MTEVEQYPAARDLEPPPDARIYLESVESPAEAPLEAPRGGRDEDLDQQDPLSKEEYEAVSAFRYLLRLFLHHTETTAQAVGLSPQKHQAMLAIRGFPGRDQITVGELAERLQIQHHSAVGLIDRLVAQGLAIREIAARDRRVVYVSLTPQGESLMDEASAGLRNELRQVLPIMDVLQHAFDVDTRDRL